MSTGDERGVKEAPPAAAAAAGAGGVAPGEWGLMPDNVAGGYREVLRYWFVQYNPFYFASALSVFAGVYLVAGDLGSQQTLSDSQAQLALLAVINAYEWLLVGGAAWLVWRGLGGRAAAILALLELLFLYDCSFRLESIAHLGASGAWASLAWLVLAAARLWLLVRGLRLQVPALAYSVTLGGAAGIAVFVQLLSHGMGAPLVVYQTAGWFGVALLLLLHWRRPRIECPLARLPADRIKAARALTAAPWVLSGFYFYHLWNHVLWVGDAEPAAVFGQAAVVLLAVAVVVRGEREIWGATLASVAFTLGTPPLVWVASLLAAATLAWHVRRGEHQRLLVGVVLLVWLALLSMGWQEGVAPWRARVEPGAWQSWLLVGSLVYLGWRRREKLAWVVLALGAAVSMPDFRWPDLPLPRTPLGWGLLLLGAGFAALILGLAVSWLLRAAPRHTDSEDTAASEPETGPLPVSLTAGERAVLAEGVRPAREPASTRGLPASAAELAAPDTTADPLHGYASIIEVDVAWGDMDAYRHVNNALYFRYVETARIRWLSDLGWDEDRSRHGVSPVVSEVGARFRRPVTWPDRLRIGTRVEGVVDDRIELQHLLFSDARGEVVTVARSLVVAVDQASGARRPLPDELIERLRVVPGRG